MVIVSLLELTCGSLLFVVQGYGGPSRFYDAALYGQHNLKCKQKDSAAVVAAAAGPVWSCHGFVDLGYVFV